MEKKTMDMLHAMICEEVEDIAKKGQLGTHENLDILKDLIETEKNLTKIEHYKHENKEMEDAGYSQRKYFIDADYQPGMYGSNPYGQGGRGNSYGRSRVMYDMSGPYNDGMDGHSYLYYDPRYEMPMYSQPRGYARTSGGGTKMEMMNELTQMLNETNDPNVKAAITEAVEKLNK